MRGYDWDWGYDFFSQVKSSLGGMQLMTSLVVTYARCAVSMP